MTRSNLEPNLRSYHLQGAAGPIARRCVVFASVLVGLLDCAGASLEEDLDQDRSAPQDEAGAAAFASQEGQPHLIEKSTQPPTRPPCPECRVEYEPGTGRIRLVSSRELDRVVAVGIRLGSRGIVISPTLRGLPSPARRSDGEYALDLTASLRRQLAGYGLLQVYGATSNGEASSVAAPYVEF